MQHTSDQLVAPPKRTRPARWKPWHTWKRQIPRQWRTTDELMEQFCKAMQPLSNLNASEICPRGGLSGEVSRQGAHCSFVYHIIFVDIGRPRTGKSYKSADDSGRAV